MAPRYPPRDFYTSPEIFWNRDFIEANLPIQNQGNTNASTAFALTTVLHFKHYVKFGVSKKLSVQQIADHFSLFYGVRPPEGVCVNLNDAVDYLTQYGILLDCDYTWRGSMRRFVMPNHRVDILKPTFQFVYESSFQTQLQISPIVTSINLDAQYEYWVYYGAGKHFDEVYTPAPGTVVTPPLNTYTFVVVGFGFDQTSHSKYYIVQDSFGESLNAGFKKINACMFTYGYWVVDIDVHSRQSQQDDLYIRLANCSV